MRSTVQRPVRMKSSSRSNGPAHCWTSRDGIGMPLTLTSSQSNARARCQDSVANRARMALTMWPCSCSEKRTAFSQS
jgi:hypothetical protein